MQDEPSHAHQAGLFRHSVLLMAATQIGGVANLLFQMTMMRSLTVEEYGVLATMLSLVHVFVMPLEALRTTVAHQAGLLTRMGAPGNVRRLIRRWARYLLVPSLLVLAAGLGGRGMLADFFQMPSGMPVVATVLVIAFIPFMQMCVGALQGLQAFVWMSAVSQGWCLVRLAAGAAFVTLIARSATAGLSAQALGVGISIAVGLTGLRWVLKGDPREKEMDFGSLRYFLMSMFILGGYAVLMYADVMLVKRFFDPAEAGLFAKAATMGRTIIYLAIPIAGAMFPKVVSTGLASAGDRRVFGHAFLYAGSVIALTAVGVTMFAAPLWLLFTGEQPTAETIRLVRAVVWAMSPLGLTFLIMNFELAQRRFGLVTILAPLAVLYIGGVNMFHESLFQVIAVLAVVNILSVLVLLAGVMGRRNAGPAREAQKV